jgi:Holliday junction resolvase RusA-like endonuclease
MTAPLLEVTIPTLPPSVNKVYVPVTVRTRGHKAYNSIRMGKDAVTWIEQATLFLPPVRLSDTIRYRMVLEYHTDWYLKDGVTLKNKDVRNYEKLVTDTVFRRYGLSDSLVWESVVTKVQNKEKDKVVVRLFEMQ